METLQVGSAPGEVRFGMWEYVAERFGVTAQEVLANLDRYAPIDDDVTDLI